MKDFIVSSVLTRLLANIFIFFIVMGSAGIAGYDILIDKAPNSWLVLIIGTALGSSIKLLGVNAGIAFANEEKVVMSK